MATEEATNESMLEALSEQNMRHRLHIHLDNFVNQPNAISYNRNPYCTVRQLRQHSPLPSEFIHNFPVLADQTLLLPRTETNNGLL